MGRFSFFGGQHLHVAPQITYLRHGGTLPYGAGRMASHEPAQPREEPSLTA